MPRYALTIEYDGGRFYGWQRQKDGVISVQKTIEDAYLKFGKRPITLFGSGRTDTGVHATGQVAHLDDPRDIDPFRMMSGLNFYLLDTGVYIVNVQRVPDDFHARFTAQSRTYIYKILNRRPAPVLDQNRVWHVMMSLDVEAMKKAAFFLIGTHDFTSFRSIRCQANSPIRTLDALDIWKEGDMILARVQARSFLHNQVRIMIGTLVDIGKKRWNSEYILEIFEKKDRLAAGQTAPPYGLYLTHIGF